MSKQEICKMAKEKFELYEKLHDNSIWPFLPDLISKVTPSPPPPLLADPQLPRQPSPNPTPPHPTHPPPLFQHTRDDLLQHLSGALPHQGAEAADHFEFLKLILGNSINGETINKFGSLLVESCADKFGLFETFLYDFKDVSHRNTLNRTITESACSRVSPPPSPQPCPHLAHQTT